MGLLFFNGVLKYFIEGFLEFSLMGLVNLTYVRNSFKHTLSDLIR